MEGWELAPSFLAGQELFHEIISCSLCATEDDFQAMVARALATFQRCAELVRSLAVFSKGEEVDDVNTEDLKFLLIDYYSAMLHLKIVDRNRLGHINAAAALFARFLDRCEKMRIMCGEDRQVFLEVPRELIFCLARLSLSFIEPTHKEGFKIYVCAAGAGGQD